MATAVRAARRDVLLERAAHLFAERGFLGTSVEEIGAAAGISGPGVYKHFPSKGSLLSGVLVGISERLLAGGRQQVEGAADDTDALVRLVAFHADFALSSPELIRVQDRDFANLPEDGRRAVRRLQRAYVEVWVGVLRRLQPGLPAADARTAAHAAFGLLNSTPHATSPRRELLQAMALAALRQVVAR